MQALLLFFMVKFQALKRNVLCIKIWPMHFVVQLEEYLNVYRQAIMQGLYILCMADSSVPS